MKEIIKEKLGDHWVIPAPFDPIDWQIFVISAAALGLMRHGGICIDKDYPHILYRDEQIYLCNGQYPKTHIPCYDAQTVINLFQEILKQQS